MMGSLSISNVIYQQDIKRLGNIYEIDISYQITIYCYGKNIVGQQ